MYDLVVANGLVHDGKGGAPARRHIAIQAGRVAALTAELPPAARTIDASGCWVTPGFIDLHTHYDAEVEVAPALSESLRHGVTTVTLGSCSLSLAIGTPEDLADMFCRVEAIPYAFVRPLLEGIKTWDSVGDYMSHLGSLPLGPNVASFIGHSCLRAYVMGMGRSLDRAVSPTGAEVARMQGLLADSLDQGYLGLSIQTLRWDKVGGDRDYRSRPLPSTFARWSEYRKLTRLLRERGRVLQGVPNVSTKVNVLLFMLESAGLLRRPLKTTIISMMELKQTRNIDRVIGWVSRFFNRVLNADFRWQALPNIFDFFIDGMEAPVFEEFGAGTDALHLQEPEVRARLLDDPAFRRRFKRQWKSKFLPRAFHRDFNESKILACPDGSVVGKSFVEVAGARGQDVVDVFLDLVARHGAALRWYTVMANDRPQAVRRIVKHPDVLIGFSDAGAHLRNMAHYNFPLRLLRLVREAERAGDAFMTVEQAVHRLTGEIAGWLGLETGTLEPGRRADLVVIDPAGLDDKVEEVEEAPMERFDGMVRLVRRNDAAVRSVIVGGREAVERGQVCPEVGRERGFGQVLRAVS